MEPSSKNKMIVAVVGLGYVGLPLAAHIAKKGIQVLGIDKDDTKLRRLKQGKSYIPDVDDATVRTLVTSGRFVPMKPEEAIRSASHTIVTVPTPLGRDETPDLSALMNASEYISKHLQAGQTIIYESSTFPGTLEEEMLPILSRSGLRAGQDFYLGYSPERIDPGNERFPLDAIPKVVSGYTSGCLEHVKTLYDELFKTTVPVSSPRVAELCKLFENIQRLVNISLVNEMDAICRKMNINFHETLQAAATKPFGFTPYWPGPGIGGHCIPVDPLYFQWKAKQLGLFSKMIRTAHQINKMMPHRIVKRIEETSAKRESANTPRKILLLGLSYKKDVNDLRESSAMVIFKMLIKKGYQVDYHDPYVPDVNLFNKKYVSKVLNKGIIQQSDVVVILTDHSNMDWSLVKRYAASIVDTRGVMNQVDLEVNPA